MKTRFRRAKTMKSKVTTTTFIIKFVLLHSAAVMLVGRQLNRCGPVAAAAAASSSSPVQGHKPLRDLIASDRDHRARLLHLAWSVNKIIDEYLGSRSVVMFADEVHRSELGQRLLVDMSHPRLLVSSADLRLANGLIVYLRHWDDLQSADYDMVLSRLPSSDHSRHMVLWGGVRDLSDANDRIDLHRIQVTFEAFWQYQLIDVAVLVPVSTGSIRVYTFNPYTGSRCNKAGPPIMINIWSSWINAFLKPNKVFGLENKLKNLHKYILQ